MFSSADGVLAVSKCCERVFEDTGQMEQGQGPCFHPIDPSGQRVRFDYFMYCNTVLYYVRVHIRLWKEERNINKFLVRY